MEVGKRQGYWVRDKGLPCLQHSKWHDLHIQVPARARGGTGRWALVGMAAARLYQSWGDSTQETQIFIRMLQANLPPICLKRRDYLYYTAQQTNCPLSPKGTLSCRRNILDQNRSQHHGCWGGLQLLRVKYLNSEYSYSLPSWFLVE